MRYRCARRAEDWSLYIDVMGGYLYDLLSLATSYLAASACASGLVTFPWRATSMTRHLIRASLGSAPVGRADVPRSHWPLAKRVLQRRALVWG